MIESQTNSERPDTDEDTGFTGSARQRAIEAYEGARESVADAGRRAADTLTEAPLIALAGGIAAGALIAALLPATEAETRAVRPTARRVRRTAKAAVDAAREESTARLNELGLTREKGAETIRSVLQGAGEAARSSARAALDSARNEGR
jgi:hypothetical protein